MSNMAFIYQPHFKTGMFRVAISQQAATGDNSNYIVVTCSETYNGIWAWRHSEVENVLGYWTNKNTACYTVPIEYCRYVKSLQELTDKSIITKVKKQQNKWYKSEVENRDYEYKKKPEWML